MKPRPLSEYSCHITHPIPKIQGTKILQIAFQILQNQCLSYPWDIESFFKTGKEYLSLLPLSKWTRETIDGKLLNDIISTIVYLKMRKALSGTGITMTRLFGRASSLMCTRKADGKIIVETPSRQVMELFRAAGIKIPSSLGIEDFEAEYLLKPKVTKEE